MLGRTRGTAGLLLLLWLRAALGLARPETDQVVLELQAGDGAPRAELTGTLRELLARLGLTLVAPQDAQTGRVLARVRIALEAGQTEVRVLADDTHAEQQRSVPRAETASLDRETIGHVVLGMVEPLVQHEPPPPPAPAREVAPMVLSIGAGAGVLRATTDKAGALLFANVTLGAQPPLQPAGRLVLGGVPHMALAARGAEADLRMFTVRAQALLTPWQRGRAALVTGLSAGLNVLTMKSGEARADTTYARDTLRLQPIVGPLLALQLRVHRAFGLSLTCGLDIDPMPRSWQVERDARRLTFVESPYLLPYLTLGLDVHVARTRAYGSEP